MTHTHTHYIQTRTPTFTFLPPSPPRFCLCASGVTREDLIAGLRRCMTASPLFATPCIQLVLDKAASTIDDVKVDAYETLALCPAAFGHAAVAQHYDAVYTHIRRELFETLEGSVQQAALAALSAFARLADTRERAADMTRVVLEEASHLLLDIDPNTISIFGKLLVAITGAAVHPAATVFEEFVPKAAGTFTQVRDCCFVVAVCIFGWVFDALLILLVVCCSPPICPAHPFVHNFAAEHTGREREIHIHRQADTDTGTHRHTHTHTHSLSLFLTSFGFPCRVAGTVPSRRLWAASLRR